MGTELSVMSWVRSDGRKVLLSPFPYYIIYPFFVFFFSIEKQADFSYNLIFKCESVIEVHFSKQKHIYEVRNKTDKENHTKVTNSLSHLLSLSLNFSFKRMGIGMLSHRAVILATL